jgi:hypothetical protein
MIIELARPLGRNEAEETPPEERHFLIYVK